ncbi:conserved Plasmodium protein, unknown function [Plasmodium knowlesi strain H]|uniref:Phosphatase n=3 Tax=Plasmodium knowlesi TaxID=5850 RepID=A0A1A7VWM4_PLAKH|nr:phosphatase, putative [Plasmodium knowlesi strain H]OTN68116.1 Uncharacterized protein PKNOH_S04355000 [Plasmodium knowlesi]CAA9986915.1 phosphatase, putative [Plasmodium knowlesi strain H]SBO26518.1 conserved Plasmodium protein, unknown function [Plasmodium knowlesi strain H]SBO28119.1 conserved Plasmodium protein, unknown function [Plasmodium knowlesi strain H]VVS76389.1 phosphatase, putative [Plasmodium knowlesi strain H]
MATTEVTARVQGSRAPRLKRALCVKYITFLSYAKKINLKGPWNRYYGCLFRTAGTAITSMRGLMGTAVIPRGGRLPRNKDMLFDKLLNHMLSKPVKIASFDFDGTLMNPTGEKHPNNVLISREAIQNIIVLKKIHQYKVVIFSNQTNVSSPLYDSTHMEQNKLPVLFSKVEQLTDALRYFNSFYASHPKVPQKGDTHPSIWRQRGRTLPSHTPIGTAHRNNSALNAFFAIGKGSIEALDIYPKPSDGQYCLFICLEGIKYVLLLMSYFAKAHRILLERQAIKQKDKPLGEFLQLVLDMLSNRHLQVLVKKLRRRPFHLNKIRLLILDVYLNTLLRKMELYRRFEKEYPAYAAHVEFFLSDAEWSIHASEGGHDDCVGEFPSPDLLRDELFLTHLTRCLAQKNDAMKRLAVTFSSVLFNFKESFYAGDNVGRDFDKSDVDLQFAARTGMRLLDDGHVRHLGGPKQ